MTTYLEAARALPIPSDEQTRTFAEYVTGAHSWYKHLPMLPLSPFVFFLDPNAGRSMVHVTGDEVAFVDNTDGNPGIHYTWQTTDAYRRRFGCWNYEAPYGKSLQYMSDQGVVDTGGAGLRVADADSTCWLEIPATLTTAGTALVSSLMFCHGAGTPGQHLPEPKYQVSILEPFSGLPPDGEGHGAVIGAIHRLIALRAEDSYLQEAAVFTHAKNALYEKAEAAGESWSGVYHSEAYRTAEVAWEQSAPGQREQAMMALLAAAIGAERAKQIDGLQIAMRRFVEALHADGSGAR